MANETQKPAYDYDSNRPEYSRIRQADPSITKAIRDAIGDSPDLINIGAGTGSYEPEDLYVVAIEPSSEMRKQRLQMGRRPAVKAYADNIPFDDQSFGAALASITVHHWPDLSQGMKEVRRVTRGKILILTFDPDRLGCFWNIDYFPDLVEIEKQRYPSLNKLKDTLPDDEFSYQYIQVPLNCTDGFQEAFYGRPEAYLDPAVRKSQSAWGFIHADREKELVANFKKDLESREWDRKFGHLRKQATLGCGLVLVEFSPGD